SNPTTVASEGRQEQIEREREAARQAAQERRQLEEQQKMTMRRKQSHLVRATVLEVNEPAVLNLFPSRIFFVTKTTVTDVGVTVAGAERIADARNTDKHETDPFELTFWFGEADEPKIANGYRYGKQESGPVFQMEIPWQLPGHAHEHETMCLYFDNSARLQQLQEAAAKARGMWRANYGDLAQG